MWCVFLCAVLAALRLVGCQWDVVPGPHTCPPGTRYCKSQGYEMCLREIYWCDGVWDCSNPYDELHCPRCSPLAFPCDGVCVRWDWRCDGTWDCRDGTDEMGCGRDSSQNTKRRCRDGTTRHSWVFCNGVWDCQDDEWYCTDRMCQGGAIWCDGRCVSGRYRCDGTRFCSEGQDEEYCSNPYLGIRPTTIASTTLKKLTTTMTTSNKITTVRISKPTAAMTTSKKITAVATFKPTAAMTTSKPTATISTSKKATAITAAKTTSKPRADMPTSKSAPAKTTTLTAATTTITAPSTTADASNVTTITSIAVVPVICFLAAVAIVVRTCLRRMRASRDASLDEPSYATVYTPPRTPESAGPPRRVTGPPGTPEGTSKPSQAQMPEYAVVRKLPRTRGVTINATNREVTDTPGTSEGTGTPKAFSEPRQAQMPEYAVVYKLHRTPGTARRPTNPGVPETPETSSATVISTTPEILSEWQQDQIPGYAVVNKPYRTHGGTPGQRNPVATEFLRSPEVPASPGETATGREKSQQAVDPVYADLQFENVSETGAPRRPRTEEPLYLYAQIQSRAASSNTQLLQ